MKDIVFIGPSLSIEEATKILPASYREPVKLGDVYRAVQERPRSLTIIDGLFEQVPAVWHKEILYALNQGIPVIGASSMGALRAAELWQFGMTGIGSVFEQYRTGTLTDDDEVAIAHAPAADGYRCTSVAMVSIRKALQDLMDEGLVDNDEHDQLVDLSKERFYPERTWGALLQDAETLGMAADRVEAIRQYIECLKPDIKRENAILALKYVAELAESEVKTDFVFEHTVYWETVETYYAPRSGSDNRYAGRFERIRNHMRIFETDREQLRQTALLFFLCEQESRRLRLGDVDDREVLTRFRQRRGLSSSAELHAWLDSNRVSRAECLMLARIEAIVTLLGIKFCAQVDKYLPIVAMLEGRDMSISDKVARKWDLVSDINSAQIDESLLGNFDDVLDWYRSSFGEFGTTLEKHAAELGIGNVHQLREELYVEYLANVG